MCEEQLGLPFRAWNEREKERREGRREGMGLGGEKEKRKEERKKKKITLGATQFLQNH